ncbi:hypothetical protein FOA43_001624 [Brettanomyces nanus]|uniref:L-type lectin-like domain-containing protein n=1 Tax=Eeniella nana TaxID=13502 RepID=A0A875RZZ6_EENNA|nr:uncharacterized protein FOA43_001624 [Brettanomyces nanus]QPG74298.1 hypothetical protein FOA43_001624 [Brettanomyces nanus]
MDLNYSRSRNSPLGKVKHFYARLTIRAKVLLGCLFLFVFYRQFLRSFSTSDQGLNDKISESEHISSISLDDSTKDQKISMISLTYMNLEDPFMNPSTLQFYNYINGGNMQLERNADYIRLVADRPSAVGYVVSRNSISEEDSSALQIELDFRLHGSQNKPDLIGDGMALWITESPLNRGDVFGMQSDYKGLGIFIDTYRNADRQEYKTTNKRRFPYLSLQPNFGDVGRYIKSNDGFQTELDGCSLHDIYNPGEENTVSKMRIIYLRDSQYLQIDVDAQGAGDWKTCVQRRDIPRILIPKNPYLAISAETGELFQAVDIYSMKVQTFRMANGDLVKSVSDLLEGLEIGLPEQSIEKPESSGDSSGKRSLGGGGGGIRHRQRRTLKRLQRQERELKRKDAEKYGDPRGFIGWFGKLVWKITRTILYTILAIILAYFCLIAYRIYRDKRRSKQPQGLL